MLFLKHGISHHYHSPLLSQTNGKASRSAEVVFTVQVRLQSISVLTRRMNGVLAQLEAGWGPGDWPARIYGILSRNWAAGF